MYCVDAFTTAEGWCSVSIIQMQYDTEWSNSRRVDCVLCMHSPHVAILHVGIVRLSFKCILNGQTIGELTVYAYVIPVHVHSASIIQMQIVLRGQTVVGLNTCLGTTAGPLSFSFCRFAVCFFFFAGHSPLSKDPKLRTRQKENQSSNNN